MDDMTEFERALYPDHPPVKWHLDVITDLTVEGFDDAVEAILRKAAQDIRALAEEKDAFTDTCLWDNLGMTVTF